MKDLFKNPRIIFLNQMAGPLFRELAEDISKEWSPGLLFTGHPDTLKNRSHVLSLSIIAAPKYQCKSNLSRLLSGMHYFFCALLRCWRLPRGALVFTMANPLCLAMVGYLLKRLRGQHYVVLVYDIYPDVLVNFGPLKETNWIVRFWHRLNRVVWENADIVFTIGDAMAETLEQRFDADKTIPGKVIAIPNWANTDWIRPIAKSENEFAKKYNQTDKLTVMYSGNLGQTHDIETIIGAAKELKGYDSIHFMIIGEGAKKKFVEEEKSRNNLENLTILPFQPEDVLPLSLPTADISIVTLDKGSENLSAPSKTAYVLAAGAAMFGLCGNNSAVAHIINRHQCGLVIKPGDVSRLANKILTLYNDREKLNYYQTNSRNAAEEFYSKKNTNRYLELLSVINN